VPLSIHELLGGERGQAVRRSVHGGPKTYHAMAADLP